MQNKEHCRLYEDKLGLLSVDFTCSLAVLTEGLNAAVIVSTKCDQVLS